MTQGEESGERFGPYEVLGRLGRGGMGEVFRARHLELGRIVALKVIRRLTAGHEEHLVRFRREAEVASRLSHPGLVRLLDYGEVQGVPYLAMELVSGKTLADTLRDQGPTGVEQALRVARECLAALSTCHEAGLVHRDVKPGNLMLDESGRVRLLDLGLVKITGQTILTGTGEFVGTPAYAAPEALMGREVDCRCDIYQVGLVVYECVTGQPPFIASSLPDLLQLVLTSPPPAIDPARGGENVRLRGLLEKTLSKNPADRFGSCAEALAFLDRPLSRPRSISRAAPRAVSSGPVGDLSGGWAATTAGARRVLPVWIALLGAGLAVGIALWCSRGGDPGVGCTVAAAGSGWEVAWPRTGPLRGRVAVASSPEGPWVEHDEPESREPRETFHRVRFQARPEPGQRLLYRIRVGQDPPGECRPLEVSGDDAPQELEVQECGPVVTVRWWTRGQVVGAVSVAPGRVTSAETMPSQAHGVQLSGLPEERELTCSIRGSAGRVLATRPFTILSPVKVMREYLQVVEPGVIEVRELLKSEFDVMAVHRPVSPSVRRRYAQAVARAFPAGAVARLIPRVARVKGRIADDRRIPADLRSRWVGWVHQLWELREGFRRLFGSDLGLPAIDEEGSGTVPERSPPADVVELLAIVLGDGGRAAGRSPYAGPGPLLDPPGTPRFVQQEQLFLSGMTGGQSEGTPLEGRSSLTVPALPLPRPLPWRLYLRYRIAGGRIPERLAITVGSDTDREDRPRLAVLRAGGRVSEGVIRVDPRLLEHRTASLEVRHKTLPVKVPDGITLDHLVFLGGRP